KVSPGMKFGDAELLGVPNVLVAGRGLADGVVELRDRFTGESTDLPVDEAADAVVARLREQYAKQDAIELL
ncbi:His/Gly/Thr/Pro-type tRNA ligase C-terminal domain-containing protein, partial [Brevibacterium paucivorans]